MERASVKASWIKWSVYAVTFLLMIEVISLMNQNAELKKTIKTLTIGDVEPLQSGDQVEAIRIQTLAGDTTSLNFNNPSVRHLLFILSTSCPHCERNLPAWTSIDSSNVGAHTEILGLSVNNLEQTQDFVVSKHVSFHTVAIVDTNFRAKYRITGVPTTLMVEGTGGVMKVWVGELTAEQTQEIRNMMGATGALTN